MKDVEVSNLENRIDNSIKFDEAWDSNNVGNTLLISESMIPVLIQSDDTKWKTLPNGKVFLAYRSLVVHARNDFDDDKVALLNESISSHDKVYNNSVAITKENLSSFLDNGKGEV